METKPNEIVRRLKQHGFDKSHVDDGRALVGCSQCQPMVINGTAVHELTCPNEK